MRPKYRAFIFDKPKPVCYHNKRFAKIFLGNSKNYILIRLMV